MLHHLVQVALEDARTGSRELSHSKRSTEWVRSLARQLSNHCCDLLPEGPVIAFCRADATNRAEFRLNELLFDILVATTQSVEGPALAANNKEYGTWQKSVF
jgi:hypothetical protein